MPLSTLQANEVVLAERPELSRDHHAPAYHAAIFSTPRKAGSEDVDISDEFVWSTPGQGLQLTSEQLKPVGEMAARFVGPEVLKEGTR